MLHCKITQTFAMNPVRKFGLILLLLIPALSLTAINASILSPSSLFWKEKFKEEIDSYRGLADQIIDQVLSGPARGQAYERLSLMTDTFGYRLCGSPTLEKTIDYMVNQLKKDGLENVHKEAVKVPHWVRGKEKAAMVAPRHKAMAILGLGSSVGTPREGITAEVIVVKSFDELSHRATEAEGKIVVFNYEWIGYSKAKKYREKAASEAAKVGARAALVRSATGFSVYSPHAGAQQYEEGIRKIPAASITVEDAELLWRLSKRGETIKLFLYMEARNLPSVVSYNTVAEIRGSTFPEEVVLVSGHLDSWDVGEGAMDDGGGAFISWQVLSLIKQLNFRPKRTLRLVMWTCEEPGSVGGKGYFQSHKSESSKMDLIMESDGGTFTPMGLGFTGTKQARRIMKYLVKTLLGRVNATQLLSSADTPDTNDWADAGIPTGSLSTKNAQYFDFHHTNGDTMTVEDPLALDLCSAVWAVTAFTVANLESMLPANRELPGQF